MGLGGSWHWLLLLVVVFLLFGHRLPSVMRSLGRGVTEFKKGMEGIDEDEDVPRVKKEKPSEPVAPSASAAAEQR